MLAWPPDPAAHLPAPLPLLPPRSEAMAAVRLLSEGLFLGESAAGFVAVVELHHAVPLGGRVLAAVILVLSHPLLADATISVVIYIIVILFLCGARHGDCLWWGGGGGGGPSPSSVGGAGVSWTMLDVISIVEPLLLMLLLLSVVPGFPADRRSDDVVPVPAVPFIAP